MRETTRRSARRLAARLDLLIGVGALVVWWTSRAGIVMSPTLVAAQAVLPYLVIPVFVALIGSLLLRRCREATLLLIAGVFIVWAFVPLVSGSEPPAWTTTAPTLKVAAANLFAGNMTLDEAFDEISTLDADVVILSEVTPRVERVLDDSPLRASYPFRQGEIGDLILSRLPIVRSRQVGDCALTAPSAIVEVGGREVEVIGVHTFAPTNWLRRESWSQQFLGLERLVASRRGSTFVVAGDFNATWFHAPFRALVDAGTQDAHNTLGEGWRPSWGPRQIPVVGRIGVLRLDHSLSAGQISPVAVRDVRLPGSDHQAVLVTYAVRPAAGIQEGRVDS